LNGSLPLLMHHVQLQQPPPPPPRPTPRPTEFLEQTEWRTNGPTLRQCRSAQRRMRSPKDSLPTTDPGKFAAGSQGTCDTSQEYISSRIEQIRSNAELNMHWYWLKICKYVFILAWEQSQKENWSKFSIC
jgi:hypothetical protein